MEDGTKKPRKRQMSREKRILANRHERERVRKMNDAYEELRSSIPNYEETRVKTKLELLRIATNYIQTLKERLQSVIHDHYGSSMNSVMSPPAYGMGSSGVSKPGHRISEYPYPPSFPAPPPPPSELSPRHIAHHQTFSGGSQFPPPMTGVPDSSDSSVQDFCSLFTSSLNDCHLEENFLYNLQVTALYGLDE